MAEQYFYLRGYATRFDETAIVVDDTGAFLERIAPTAFDKSLAEDGDVGLLWSHNTADIMARTPKTLTVSPDSKGLAIRASVRKTPQTEHWAAQIEERTVRGMSIGFVVRGDAWEMRDGKPMRTIVEAELLEVTLTPWPAYRRTSVFVTGKGASRERDRALDNVRYWLEENREPRRLRLAS